MTINELRIIIDEKDKEYNELNSKNAELNEIIKKFEKELNQLNQFHIQELNNEIKVLNEKKNEDI